MDAHMHTCMRVSAAGYDCRLLRQPQLQELPGGDLPPLMRHLPRCVALPCHAPLAACHASSACACTRGTHMRLRTRPVPLTAPLPRCMHACSHARSSHHHSYGVPQTPATATWAAWPATRWAARSSPPRPGLTRPPAPRPALLTRKPAAPLAMPPYDAMPCDAVRCHAMWCDAARVCDERPTLFFADPLSSLPLACFPGAARIT